ncbi:hypothetical protein ACVS58_004760 [Vibrio parahaemolyticus]
MRDGVLSSFQKNITRAKSKNKTLSLAALASNKTNRAFKNKRN